MKKFFRIVGIVALILVAYTGFQGVFTGFALAGYMIYAVISGRLDTDMLQNPDALMNSPVMQEYTIDAMAIGLFLSAAAMLLFMHLTKLFRLRKSLLGSLAMQPLLLSTALVFTSMFALNIFVQWLPLENILENEFEGLSHTILGAFTISILAPILEEVMFRGAIQGCMLRNLRSARTAIIVSALIFGIFHMNPVQVVYATLLGIIFGWMYYRTGSLMSVIVGHVLNNTFATITTLMFGSSDESEIIGDFLSPAATICVDVVAFLFFATVSVFIALKLHRSLPPVPVPWHDSDEPAKDAEPVS